MPINSNAKIVPHLWFAERAEEAAEFYASVFPDSRVDAVTHRERARRVTEAMLHMKKFDIAELERAHEGGE